MKSEQTEEIKQRLNRAMEGISIVFSALGVRAMGKHLTVDQAMNAGTELQGVVDNLRAIQVMITFQNPSDHQPPDR